MFAEGQWQTAQHLGNRVFAEHSPQAQHLARMGDKRLEGLQGAALCGQRVHFAHAAQQGRIAGQKRMQVLHIAEDSRALVAGDGAHKLDKKV